MSLLKKIFHTNVSKALLFIVTLIPLKTLFSWAAAIYIRTFHDACYTRGSTYSPMFRLLPEKKLVCVTPKHGTDSYGGAMLHTLVGSDYDSFKDLGQLYAKDKNHIYYQEDIIEADRDTFRKLDNYSFAIDKNGLIYEGKRDNEIFTYTEEKKGFRLQYPKRIREYAQGYDESPHIYPILFKTGPKGERCHGTTYSKGETFELTYDVQVFRPKNCWITHNQSFVSDIEIDGVKGKKWYTDDGYEEMEFIRNDYRYFIRKKGHWHEKMLPKFSFIDD